MGVYLAFYALFGGSACRQNLHFEHCLNGKTAIIIAIHHGASTTWLSQGMGDGTMICLLHVTTKIESILHIRHFSTLKK